MDYALGIDLGGTRIKSVVVTPQGQALVKENISFKIEAEFDWATAIREMAERLQLARGEPANWIGVSAPGLVAAEGQSIACMPGRLQGLEGLDWAEFLKTTQPVPVLNDAHAALTGEAWVGAAKGFQNVIMYTLGTGVGGAAIVDGRLLRGQIGRAGHLGHLSLDRDGPPDICGCPGSLEVCIGNCTIQDRSGGRFSTTHDLVAAHLAGDKEASRVWLRSVEDLARAITSSINILDPEAVIIGGGIARAGNALFEPLKTHLNHMEWRPGGHQVKLLPATLGEFAGAFGAAWHAMGSQ